MTGPFRTASVDGHRGSGAASRRQRRHTHAMRGLTADTPGHDEAVERAAWDPPEKILANNHVIDIRGGFTHALGRLSDSQRLCILDKK